MVETPTKTGEWPSSASTGTGTQKAATVAEQASALASEAKEQASGVLDHVTRQLSEQTSGLVESAKDFASDAGDKLRTAVDDQKGAGADFVSGMAGAIRRASNEFEGSVPQAVPYIRRAADQIDSVANALQRRDVNELLRGVQDFARRQPTAFFGATVLAGFAAIRFLKSTTGDPGSEQRWSGGTNVGSRGPMAMGTANHTGGAGLAPALTQQAAQQRRDAQQGGVESSKPASPMAGNPQNQTAGQRSY